MPRTSNGLVVTTLTVIIILSITVCFGYDTSSSCFRSHNSNSIANHCRRSHHVVSSSSRLMAEPPSPLELLQEAIGDGSIHKKEEEREGGKKPSSVSVTVTVTTPTPPRLSKRKRITNLVGRFRSRVSSLFLRPKKKKEQQSALLESEDVALMDTAPILSLNNETRFIEEVAEHTHMVATITSPPEEDVTVTANNNSQQQQQQQQRRQFKAATNIDLSGTWRPIVTSSFKKEYDSYLQNCSQPYVFRKVLVNGIGLQRETIRQLDDGIALEIVATNPAGNWNRTLVTSSDASSSSSSSSSLQQPKTNGVAIIDPDGDTVQVEAWWEEYGTRHKSVLKDKPRVEGGVFETVRYLESDDDDVLVCESSFIPSSSTTTTKSKDKFKYGYVVWKFQRDG